MILLDTNCSDVSMMQQYVIQLTKVMLHRTVKHGVTPVNKFLTETVCTLTTESSLVFVSITCMLVVQ